MARALPATVDLIELAGGDFTMGAEPSLSPIWDSTPAHTVTLSPFSMSATEVTYAQYLEFLNAALADSWVEFYNVSSTDYVYANFELGSATARATEGDFAGELLMLLSGEPTEPDPDNKCWLDWDADAGAFVLENDTFAEHPAAHVTYYGAHTFAEYYGVALPTEAQWEYAARADRYDFDYPTVDGTLSAATANANDDVGHTTAVGSYEPNAFGFYDLAGNSYEWCLDWYLDDYYSWASAAVDPQGPPGTDADPATAIPFATSWDNTSRVIRGGSFNYVEMESTSFFGTAARHSTYAYVTTDHWGFRVAESTSTSSSGSRAGLATYVIVAVALCSVLLVIAVAAIVVMTLRGRRWRRQQTTDKGQMEVGLV